MFDFFNANFTLALLFFVVFDFLRAALEWLIQNYALSASVFKVDASILQLKSVESELRQHQSTVGLQTSIRQSQLSDVNLYIGWLNHRRRELIVAQQANEREYENIQRERERESESGRGKKHWQTSADCSSIALPSDDRLLLFSALSVGFIFLDSSLSGTLEVNETPGLTAKLFNLLDGHRRNYLTLESLHECITQLSAKLDKWTMRTEKLIDDNHRLTGMATDTALYTIEKNKGHNHDKSLWSLGDNRIGLHLLLFCFAHVLLLTMGIFDLASR